MGGVRCDDCAICHFAAENITNLSTNINLVTHKVTYENAAKFMFLMCDNINVRRSAEEANVFTQKRTSLALKSKTLF